jgi:thiazole/oxazole-forming peptide maturase SagC family component
MKLEINEEKLFFQPTQILEFENSVILKRGINQLQIEGEMAFEIIKVVATLASEDGCTEDYILDYLGGYDNESIISIINELKEKGFLITDPDAFEYDIDNDEYRQKIFYENLNVGKDYVDALKQKKIGIIGINSVSRQIVKSLIESQVYNYQLVDNKLFRNMNFFSDSGQLHLDIWDNELHNIIGYEDWVDSLENSGLDILICTSDFGGMQLMRDFNKFCVENAIMFLPVVLQDFKGYVGPLVVPGETACFECLLSRQNSIMPNYHVKRTTECSAPEGQRVVGFHPAMSSILGDIAVMELVKFFTKTLQSWNVGALIEVNLLKTEMKSRKVLKIPRCPVCSEMNKISRVTIYNSTFNPTNDD